MKKVWIVILCAVLLCGFTACGAEQDIRGDQIVVDGADGKEFELGQTSGLNYENKFVGIGCNLGSDWVFYTDEQLRELNNQTADMAGEEFQEVMANADVVFDMQAVNADGLCNINLVLEKTPALVAATYDFQKNYEKAFPTMKTSYENMGCTDYAYTFMDLTVDGKTVDGVFNTGTLGGVKMYQKQFAVKCNGYVASITVTAMGTDATDEILKTMYWID